MRSALACPPMLGRLALTTPEALVTEVLDASAPPALGPLRTLSGRLSRLPPKTDDGAIARIEALVSSELRRRRFDDDASVRMDALSVSRPLAVAAWYVTGCCVVARC